MLDTNFTNFREKLHLRCLKRILSLTIFTKGYIQLRYLMRTSSVNCFRKKLHLRCFTRISSASYFRKKLHLTCSRHGFHPLTNFVKSSILDVWQRFYLLTIFAKGSSLYVWHGLHPLATFAKSSILDVSHRFHSLTVFIKSFFKIRTGFCSVSTFSRPGFIFFICLLLEKWIYSWQY